MGFKLGLVSAAVLAIGMPSVVAQPMPAAAFKTATPQLMQRLSAGPRPCEWRHGQRSCRAAVAAGTRRRSDGYFEYDAKTLPFGTERWRDQMRRENRLGNPG